MKELRRSKAVSSGSLQTAPLAFCVSFVIVVEIGVDFDPDKDKHSVKSERPVEISQLYPHEPGRGSPSGRMTGNVTICTTKTREIHLT
jgi:hypothetical protein